MHIRVSKRDLFLDFKFAHWTDNVFWCKTKNIPTDKPIVVLAQSKPTATSEAASSSHSDMGQWLA